MSIKNVLFPAGADIHQNAFGDIDGGHARLNKAKVVYFNGATAVMRMAEFIRNYVNAATLDEGGDATDPEDYTVTDTGLAAGAIITAYADDGKAILVFQDYSEYDAATFPFNRNPTLDSAGW